MSTEVNHRRTNRIENLHQPVDAILDALNDPDGFLRYTVIAAIEKLRHDHPALVFDSWTGAPPDVSPVPITSHPGRPGLG